MSTTARQIDIRVGAVKRLTKEMKSRITDVGTEKRRTQKFMDAGEDKWTVGKQEEVVAEAEKMIPDARQRLEAGLADLKALLEAAGSEVEEGKTTDAEKVINEGEEALKDLK